MCSGSQLQTDDAETEKVRDEKLLVMPYGLAKRFVLEGSIQSKDVDRR